MLGPSRISNLLPSVSSCQIDQSYDLELSIVGGSVLTKLRLTVFHSSSPLILFIDPGESGIASTGAFKILVLQKLAWAQKIVLKDSRKAVASTNEQTNDLTFHKYNQDIKSNENHSSNSFFG